MKLNLLTYPNKKLRLKSRKVIDIDEIRSIIPCMLKIMKRDDGVALAAPQVGILKRFFVVAASILPHTVIVNPSWKPNEESRRILVREGCLSLPGIFLTISRWDVIKVEYQDIDGESHLGSLGGFGAQVFQHEYEHLDGVLFIDHVR